MTDDALADARCSTPCYVPFVPHQMAGALLRYHRILAGLSYARAAQLTEIPGEQLQGMELARKPVTAQTVRTLLHAYGAPEQDVQSAVALMPPTASGHQHQVNAAVLQHSGWTPALKTGAQEVVIFSSGALTPALDLAVPLPPVPGRPHHCRTVLLLHESAVDRTPAEHLAALVRLVERKAFTVRLISPQFAAPAPLLTEWTLTAWRWDGTAVARRRRQLHVAYDPQEAPVARNGRAAAEDRQVIQAASRHSLPTPASVHLLQQALRHTRPGPTGHRSPAGTIVDGSAARRSA
ncbi:helix-turn-helix domain-containing protein [Streptomyces misionensis]|uniref:helix-turn-helix domain-containing protein n=1 Tax=Streptomyces misionensis TaxID=67331 RepID=UPI0034400EAE